MREEIEMKPILERIALSNGGFPLKVNRLDLEDLIRAQITTHPPMIKRYFEWLRARKYCTLDSNHVILHWVEIEKLLPDLKNENVVVLK